MGKCKQSTTAEALKNDFYFISIDLPAHGKTAPFESEDDYRIDRIAEWVNDLCIGRSDCNVLL